MDAPDDLDLGRSKQDVASLERLTPADDGAVSVERIVEELGLWERPAPRRRVMLNMVSTVDGRATLEGRSGPLSDSADRKLFHGLRSAVDAVLVGAGTVRAERYGRIIPDASRRSQRLARGLSEEPLACVVSGRVALEPDIPLLREPAARVVILTASQASLPDSPAQIDYVRCGHDGQLDLAAALTELCERFHVSSILCEGGPHLAFQLLTAGLVDELFLSLSPLLAGGEPAGGEALRILAGGELQPPVELDLLTVLRAGSSLFLRLRRLCVRARLSRDDAQQLAGELTTF
jgi:riboflavin biosynthesis pyrimidine reductase